MDFAREAADYWSNSLDHGDGTDAIAVEIGVSISRLATQQTKRQTAELRQYKRLGVTGPSDAQHLMMLHRLAGREGLSMVEQSDLLSTGHAATSKRLARFEQAGLVARIDHPTDRRSHQWFLTDDGAQLAESSFEALSNGRTKAVAHLSPEQRESVAEALRLLLSSPRS